MALVVGGLPTPLGGGRLYRNAVQRTTIKGIEAIALSLRGSIADLSRQMDTKTPGILNDAAKAFSIDRNRRIFEDANKELAERARVAMKVRLASTRTSSVEEYRYGQNRLTGKLDEYFDGPELNQSTAFRISFLNVQELNENARHWMRINYGAGDAAGPSEDAPSAIIFGESFEIGSPPGLGKRPTPMIPKGMWREGGGYGGSIKPDRSRAGSDAFFPMLGATEFKPTRGIRAHHFIQAGFAAVAEHADATYRQVFRDIAAARGNNWLNP